MSEARFSLIFRGLAVDNGEIDVHDLAPALLAVGDLLQAANQAINGEQAAVGEGEAGGGVGAAAGTRPGPTRLCAAHDP